MTIAPRNRPRLVRDDFIALRSLANSRWLQGEGFIWRFNNGWRCATYSDVPALDAADRLVAMGLAEDAVCDCGCRRPMFQLTPRGRAFVERMNKPLLNAELPASVPMPAEVKSEEAIKSLYAQLIARIRRLHLVVDNTKRS